MKIIPLGGLEQIGMNITAFEYGDSIIVVDCGLAFPEDEMFGIDMVIPDVTYLEENIDKVKGFVITHGHEDHIGALPYILRSVNVPVYATRLTMAIIENKLEEHKQVESTKRHVCTFGQTIELGDFSVEFIKTNHSIVDAAALAITCAAGTVIHTGDFKVDYTPVFGDAIDLARFAELGEQGVLALLCDSTNSEEPGFTESERTVGTAIDRIFEQYSGTRIIIATFASNVDRVQQIVNSACKYGRKVVVEGRSMVNIIETAEPLGCLKIPDNTLVNVDDLKLYPEAKTVIITTGSQGESMAALSRMADGTHKKVTIGPGDTVIFSSDPIPGNEKAITGVINKLLKKGAEVIFQDVHVSGHPKQEDVKLIYTLVRPRFAIPVHGEYRHLKAQAKIAAELGIPSDRVFILRNGDILELDGENARMNGHVQTGGVFVDGFSVGEVGSSVLHDRQKLADEGIVIVSLALYYDEGVLAAGPEMTSRGFIYEKLDAVDENKAEAEAALREAIMDCIASTDLSNGQNRNRLRNTIKDCLGSYFWKRIKRRPMILPIILDI